MSALFTPLSIGTLSLPNRIVIAPMCQYSADGEGSATDWHLMHLGSMALSGAGLLIVEATAVSPEGRITAGDLGLYDDANEAALARVMAAIRRHGPTPPMPWAIQLGHAGRKASSRVPWEGGSQVATGEPGGWSALAPSALAHIDGEQPPLELDEAGLRKIKSDFAQAARRAVRLGFQGIELHAAHGYLLHQFLSPLSNQRSDAWGGSLDHRMRLPLEVFDAVREAVPSTLPVWARVSATDWVEGGWDLDSTISFGHALKARGCAAMHVSTGGVSSRQQIKPGPGYQVPFAQRVKEAVGLPTIAVGLITEPAQAEAIVAAGQADAVALARAMLVEPHWPWRAASELGAQVVAPQAYWRSHPNGVKGLFVGARIGMR